MSTAVVLDGVLSSRVGQSGPTLLRRAATEGAQQAWRPEQPVARALRRHPASSRQGQSRQSRRHAQGPDRRVARPLALGDDRRGWCLKFWVPSGRRIVAAVVTAPASAPSACASRRFAAVAWLLQPRSTESVHRLSPTRTALLHAICLGHERIAGHQQPTEDPCRPQVMWQCVRGHWQCPAGDRVGAHPKRCENRGRFRVERVREPLEIGRTLG
jgi:hypothetical protein